MREREINKYIKKMKKKECIKKKEIKKRERNTISRIANTFGFFVVFDSFFELFSAFLQKT